MKMSQNYIKFITVSESFLLKIIVMGDQIYTKVTRN